MATATLANGQPPAAAVVNYTNRLNFAADLAPLTLEIYIKNGVKGGSQYIRATGLVYVACKKGVKSVNSTCFFRRFRLYYA